MISTLLNQVIDTNMVNSKQLQVGNETEEIIADFFTKKGYYPLIIPKKVTGQPFDIVACKGKKEAWLVDAKHLSKTEASFSFERIEPNQLTSMMIASKFYDMSNVGFVIKWDRDESRLFLLRYEDLLIMKKNGQKSVKIELLEDFEVVLANDESNDK